jgi:4'-phosphopantetheinyl transferase
MNARLYWLTQTLAEVPENDDWLSSGEMARLSRMRFPKRRDDWRLGRWTAKKAVRACGLVDATDVTSLEIQSAQDGAPEVFWNGRLLDVSISISHSHGRGFCVVCPGRLALGCDLELIEPREERFADDYLTPDEQDFLKQVPDSELLPALNLLWSAKETMLKALREGLRRDTRSVAVSVGGGGCAGGWSRWTGRCLESRRVFHGCWRSQGAFVYTMGADRPAAVPEEAEGAGIAI